MVTEYRFLNSERRKANPLRVLLVVHLVQSKKPRVLTARFCADKKRQRGTPKKLTSRFRYRTVGAVHDPTPPTSILYTASIAIKRLMNWQKVRNQEIANDNSKSYKEKFRKIGLFTKPSTVA
ncbi:MAG: hypothetical protein D3922_12615 [Candidatus Electrothrix sp. AR1]|nr:hypothetical protein [Candidatus Electrothrix sp. AR1]